MWTPYTYWSWRELVIYGQIWGSGLELMLWETEEEKLSLSSASQFAYGEIHQISWYWEPWVSLIWLFDTFFKLFINSPENIFKKISKNQAVNVCFIKQSLCSAASHPTATLSGRGAIRWRTPGLAARAKSMNSQRVSAGLCWDSSDAGASRGEFGASQGSNSTKAGGSAPVQSARQTSPV